MANQNILAERYAQRKMVQNFSERKKILYERELWIAVMKAQKELGMDITSEDIEKYESVKRSINLKEINAFEKETRHDIKAKINSFIKAAGAREVLHRGMTSRDLSDNVEQMQILNACKIVFGKYVSILRHMLDKVNQYDDIILTARTHHQAAQPTLLGRRFSMWAEELTYHVGQFENVIKNYPLRGIKGPVGTQFDMLTLLGSEDKVQILEKKVAEQLGFARVLDSPGQVYPRSLDYTVISCLAQIASGPQNFAKNMRLMAGYDLATEGFKEGQVGSSAMPHKMNTRSSERICGLAELIKMYADGASRLSGDQWEEGDVSCSVVRRVIMPDSCYASDGLCETTLTVLNEMGIYKKMLEKETDKYLQFLATTEILTTAVKKGIGREQAHKTIKKYAIAEALKMKEDGANPNLADALLQDDVFASHGITMQDMEAILQDKMHFTGSAKKQMDVVMQKGYSIIGRYKKEARYEPSPIL